MTTIADLPTPALLLDRLVVGRNIARMAERIRGTGVNLRPHLKTAKSADVAAMATAGQFGGITVSTLAEARYFAGRGYRDITYAVGMIPGKLPEAARLRRDGVALTLLTDNLEAVRHISLDASELETEFDILIEIDCGGHRGGVDPGDAAVLEIGKAIAGSVSLRLAGVLTHAGQSYHCADIEAVKAVAEDERAAVLRAAERLQAAGLPCTTVSAGSTPTAIHGVSLDGLTEIRPGVYMFFDLDQLGLGSCTVEDIGISVLASVIGHQPRHNRLLIDAGSLALSQDRSAGEFLPETGYGWIVTAETGRRLGDLRVDDVNQEHGMVTSDHPIPFEDLPVGARVRVLPNHACITAAAYDRYHVVDGGSEVVRTWDRVNGW